jgi:hypothetical protein
VINASRGLALAFLAEIFRAGFLAAFLEVTFFFFAVAIKVQKAVAWATAGKNGGLIKSDS